MNLWGVAPLLAAALIGGSGTAHSASMPAFSPDAAHQGVNQVRLVSRVIPANGLAADQASADWSFATATGVLSQTASGSWQVLVLVNTANGTCPAPTDFWLETNTSTAPIQGAGPATTPTADICTIPVTFGVLAPIPATASLLLAEPGAPSSLQLSISRNVPWYWYLGIPAAAGALMVVLLVVFCMALVPVYKKDGNEKRVSPFRPGWRRYRIFATGAWTLNDSWATNVTVAVAVVGAILTASSAVNSLFPGVALDRFAIVNACAGAIAGFSPLVFGALYAWSTHRNPGISADATVALPPTVTARLARRNEAILCGSARVTAVWDGTVIPVRKDTSISLGADTQVKLEDLDPIRLAGASRVRLSAGTTATLTAGTNVLIGHDERNWGYEVPVQLAEAADAMLKEDAIVAPSAGKWTRIPGGTAATLAAETTLVLPDGSTGTLINQADTVLPAGATARNLWSRLVKLPDGQAMLAGEPKGTLSAAIGAWPAGTEISIPASTRVKLVGEPRATLADVCYEPTADIKLPGGAAIVVPGGAVIGRADGKDRWPVQVLAGKTIQVPLESRISILGNGIIALPGSADVLIKGESAFNISQVGAAHDFADDGDAVTDDSGAVTISGGDIASAAQDQPAPNAKAPQSDVIMRSPAFVAAPAGAKITVAGVADIKLPIHTKVSAPRRKNFTLRHDRQIQLPQSNNALVSTMLLAVVAALVTIFGVGAELGILGLLAFKLSDASDIGRYVGLGSTIAIGLFALWYSVTAIRALADPQPGSSISAASGSSFTL